MVLGCTAWHAEACARCGVTGTLLFEIRLQALMVEMTEARLGVTDNCNVNAMLSVLEDCQCLMVSQNGCISRLHARFSFDPVESTQFWPVKLVCAHSISTAHNAKTP